MHVLTRDASEADLIQTRETEGSADGTGTFGSVALRFLAIHSVWDSGLNPF